MRSTILVRYTIHTRAVLLSIDQYMNMHQYLHNTPRQWKLQWIVNQKKQRGDYVNKEQNPIYLQPQRFKQILRFTNTYINVLKISLMTFSISDDAKLDLDVWNRIQNKTNRDFPNRNLNHTETDKRTRNTYDDVDEVRSSWSSVEVVEDDSSSEASFRCQRVLAPSIRNV